jgi:hypothetical protein
MGREIQLDWRQPPFVAIPATVLHPSPSQGAPTIVATLVAWHIKEGDVGLIDLWQRAAMHRFCFTLLTPDDGRLVLQAPTTSQMPLEAVLLQGRSPCARRCSSRRSASLAALSCW